MPATSGNRSTKSQTPVSKTQIGIKPGYGDIEAPLVDLTAWTRQISTFQTAWQQEWWRFVSDRLSKDAAFAQQLVSCKAPDDVGRTYVAFFKQALEDYQMELATLTQLGTELAATAVAVAPDGHDVLDPKVIDMLGRLNA